MIGKWILPARPFSYPVAGYAAREEDAWVGRIILSLGLGVVELEHRQSLVEASERPASSSLSWANWEAAWGHLGAESLMPATLRFMSSATMLLLFRRRGDLGRHVAHVLDVIDDEGEILPRLLGLVDAALRQLAAGVHGVGGGDSPLLQLGDGTLDLPGGVAGATGQLAHPSATTAKPRPCSPARPASMAALRPAGWSARDGADDRRHLADLHHPSLSWLTCEVA